jgi:hypothetical protein
MANSQPLVWFWDFFQGCTEGCDHGCEHCNQSYVVETDSELHRVFKRQVEQHGPPTRVEPSSQNWEGWVRNNPREKV